jgi:hypothetical protein
MTHEDLAERLGVARRTVAAWHEKPDVVLRTELQRALDTAYEGGHQDTAGAGGGHSAEGSASTIATISARRAASLAISVAAGVRPGGGNSPARS